MKKTVSLLLTLGLLLSLFAFPASAAGTELTGTWHDSEPIHNGLSCALYLDEKVKDCTELTMDLSIWEYSGAPFGNWYLYAKDLKGNWAHIGEFKLEKDMRDGHVETYNFKFKQPQSFQALALCIRDKGNYFNLTWDQLRFYLGSGEKKAVVKSTPKPSSGIKQLLTGTWKDQEPIHNGIYEPFYLDTSVKNCTDLTMKLSVVDYTGYPFGNWYLYAKDLKGNWAHIADFRIEKEQADGECRSYDFHFKNPQSFQALAICIRDKGNSFYLTWDLDFYA